MKKIYLLVFLLVSGFVFGQVNLLGDANYKLEISNGEVGFWGSSCGGSITGVLQWIAAIYDNNAFETLVQGSVSYPESGNGLANSTFGYLSLTTSK
jgi:hypothetical protein